MLCLAVFSWLTDIKGYKKAATPLIIFGMNPVAAYVFLELLSKTIRVVEVSEGDGRSISLRRYIFDHVYTPWAGGKQGSLLFAANFVFLTFLVVWIMWKKRWFLKV